MSAPTFDDLQPGQIAVLRFGCNCGCDHDPYREIHRSIELRPGSGSEGRMEFEPLSTTRQSRWEAYRFEGRWSYGSDADPLTLVEVLGAPDLTQDLEEARNTAARLMLEVTRYRDALERIVQRERGWMRHNPADICQIASAALAAREGGS